MLKIKQYQLEEMQRNGFIGYMDSDMLSEVDREIFEDDFNPSDFILF